MFNSGMREPPILYASIVAVETLTQCVSLKVQLSNTLQIGVFEPDLATRYKSLLTKGVQIQGTYITRYYTHKY
jgi:hypothetical protein